VVHLPAGAEPGRSVDPLLSARFRAYCAGVPSIPPPCHTRNDKTSDDWITPKWLIDALPAFDLDVCASKTQPWPCAKQSYTELDNGIMLPWSGFVYCNPPYGKATGAWLNRMALHNDGIALVYARTDTQAFFRNVWPFASLLLFLEGRVTFHYPDGTKPKDGHNSGGPSVLIGYGKRAAKELMNVRRLGSIVIPFRAD